MSIILLVLDILIYNFTSYNSFFFLISLNFFTNKDYLKVILLGLTIDLILLNTPFINTIILFLLFLINKKFIKLHNRSLIDYLYINLLNLGIYNLILIIINQNLNLMNFLISLIINILFYLLSYNLVKRYIKLAR